MNATVKDVMTTHVVAVTKDASFKDVAALLRQHQVSTFPVVDAAGKVIGVVSETDMLPKEALLAGLPAQGPGPGAAATDHNDFVKAIGVTAASIMTTAPVTITPDEPVTSAARLMYSCKVRSLPVVTADGYLAGIISRADVLSVFDRSDDEVRSEITDCLLDEFLVDPAALAVTVKDSVVTLTGVPENNELGHQIVQRVRHIPGVVAVRDRLNYSSPEG